MRLVLLLLSPILLGWGTATLIGGGTPGGSVEFFDDFGALDSARWISVTTGSGSITQSTSEVSVDDVAATTDGATLYHSEAVDFTKRSQYFVMVRNAHATDLAGTAFRLVEGVPVLGADADDEDMIRVEYHASNHWDIIYHSGTPASQTANYWTGAAWSTTHSPSHTPATVGDSYQIMLEVRPNGSDPEFRVLIWHKKDTTAIYTNTEDRGFRLNTSTTWVPFTSVQTHSAPFYFALGDAQSDAVDSNMEYEWIGFLQKDFDTIPDANYAYLNRSITSSFPSQYQIAAYYTLSNMDTAGDNAFYVPIDRDPEVVLRNESTIDTQWVSRPNVIKHLDIYYMLYDCRSSTGQVQICGATSIAPEGPWVKAIHNPFLTDSEIGAGTDDWKFANLYFDGDETKPWKMWVSNETEGAIYYTESPDFDTQEWITPVSKVVVGVATTWDDTFVGAPIFWKPEVTGAELWYSGYDGALWQAGCAIPSSPTDIYGSTYTKCAGNPIVVSGTALTTTSGTSTGQDLTVVSTASMRPGQWISVEQVSSLANHVARIKTVTDGTHVELYNGFGQITTGKSVYEYHGLSWGPTELRQEGTKIRMYGTPFKYADGAESTYVIETSDPTPETATWLAADKPWSIPVTQEPTRAKFNENPTFISGDLTAGSAIAASYSDNFNRTSGTNLSTNAPDPPGTYTDFITDGEGDCDTEIVSSTLVEFQANSNTTCDNDEWIVTGNEDLSSDDMCVLIEKVTNDLVSWGGGNRGIRLMLRMPRNGVGNHYTFGCFDGTCTTAGVSVDTAAGEFVESLVALTTCNLPTFAANDYVGFCVSGTGSTTTTFSLWQLDDLTDAQCTGSVCDPVDAGTWGTADCTYTPAITNLVDTGIRAAFGIVSNNPITGDTYQVDNFSATTVGAP